MVQDLCKVNIILSEMKGLLRLMALWKLEKNSTKFIGTFTDATFNISSWSECGQTGVLSCIESKSCEVAPGIYHCIDWCSAKQKPICHSSHGAEIKACTVGGNRGYALQMLLLSIYAKPPIPHVVHVESKELYDTITILHEGIEYLLSIRDLFEVQNINMLSWVPSRAKYHGCSHKNEFGKS